MTVLVGRSRKRQAEFVGVCAHCPDAQNGCEVKRTVTLVTASRGVKP